MANVSEVKFSILFDALNKLMTLTDITSSHDTNTKALAKITYLEDDTIIFQSADWNTANPASWADPDIDGSTSTWAITGIQLPEIYAGTYTFEYKYSDGVSLFSVTRQFTLQYTQAVISMDMQVLCSSSELKLTDTTSYTAMFGSTEVEPSSMTRVKTLTKPAGSGCTISPLTWTDSGNSPSVTIGGGDNEAEWIWTRIWQANIETELVYSISTWDSSKPTVYLSDKLYGDDDTFAQCDATICALAQCYSNMLDRWVASLTQNFSYRDNKRDTIILASALWNKLLWYERCGSNTETIVAALKALLGGENCDCSPNTDEVSKPITPWARMTGTGSGTVSTFNFTITGSDPTDEMGNNKDVWINNTTWDVYQKISGSWVLKGNIKGAKGDDGNASNVGTIDLLNDPTIYSTPGTTLMTAISYDFKIGNSQFEWNNDHMEIVWEGKFAHNANGKTVTVNFGGTEVMTYFTDDEVNSTNDRFTVELKIEPISAVQQHLYCKFTRGGQPGDFVGPIVIRNHPLDLNTPRSVRLYGTNSVASAADISCDLMTVTVFHTDQTIIHGGSALSVGRGLVSQLFIATEGQTTFEVTDWEANDYYMALIDDVPQSQSVVTRSGQLFFYAPGLSEGQRLLIVD